MAAGLTDTSFSYVQFEFYVRISGKQFLCACDVVLVNMHVAEVDCDGFQG